MAGCNLGKTDIGDLETDGQTGDSTADSTSDSSPESMSSSSPGSTSETSPETTIDTSFETSDGTTSPVDCAGVGEDCSNGCCEGFGCNFKTVCVACTPEGEFLDIDGAGCCEGLVGSTVEICYVPTCGDDGCPEGTAACTGLHFDHLGDQFALECPPEACLGTRTLELTNADGTDGLVCAGPDGSSECAATGGSPQQYTFESDALLLTVRFDAAVLDDYSTAGFNASFQSVAGQLTIPDASAPIVAFVESSVVSPMVYDNGRLQFTMTLSLDNPFVQIESDAEDCVSDDIAGQCACFYDGLGEYEIVVDLAIEAP